MMKNKFIFGVFASLLCVSTNAYACFSPKPGYGWGIDDLIVGAEDIYIVRLVRSEEDDRNSSDYIYHLGIVEVVKGEIKDLSPFYGDQRISSNDFNGHTDKRFWAAYSSQNRNSNSDDIDADLGRSEWPCCICGPDHGFEKGELYLYFPDKLGAFASAEIVTKKDDRWLQYVKARIAYNNQHKDVGTK